MSKSLYTQRHRAIAAAIAKQRRLKGLTQEEVVVAMGGTWSQPIIANIESGGRRLDLVELLRLADVIDLDLDVLIQELRGIPDE